MMFTRKLQWGLLLGTIALGGCSKNRTKEVEEVQAICPVFAAKVKACGDAFPKAWAAVGETGHDYETDCRGQAVGYGINHPEWMTKLHDCVVKDDCQAFASCTVGLLHVK